MTLDSQKEDVNLHTLSNLKNCLSRSPERGPVLTAIMALRSDSRFISGP